MGKPEEAQEILKALGLPPGQQTLIAAYTLLALADLAEQAKWNSAKRRSLRIHDMLVFMREVYGKEYAENTRETVRRQVLHQLEQARVVDRNPDEPGLSTNSPRTHYALSEAALRPIRAHRTKRFSREAAGFRRRHGALLEVYEAARARRQVPVRLASGKTLALSPGKHNRLQAAILKEFGPRFAPGATLLYLGDTTNKTLHIETASLKALGIRVSKHDKLPDVILYHAKKKWLFLIEAVTSHGPVSPKRLSELRSALRECTLGKIYVSAFPDLTEFKRHLQDIAWETEVWVEELPDHLIHFNGGSFLGPAAAQDA